ncbi:hypothetical protein HY490_01795, partial [Candidatus Woesearchaeota archaeon]|nr:hypothetical protein [Candidatus Woesearchaeota archaeon]
YNQFLNMFKEAFSNPFAAVALVSGCLCGGCKQFGGGIATDLCAQQDSTGTTLLAYALCVIPKTAARVGDAVSSIQGLVNKDAFKTGEDNCKELDNIISEREEAEKQAQTP